MSQTIEDVGPDPALLPRRTPRSRYHLQHARIRRPHRREIGHGARREPGSGVHADSGERGGVAHRPPTGAGRVGARPEPGRVQDRGDGPGAHPQDPRHPGHHHYQPGLRPQWHAPAGAHGSWTFSPDLSASVGMPRRSSGPTPSLPYRCTGRSSGSWSRRPGGPTCAAPWRSPCARSRNPSLRAHPRHSPA